MKCERVQEWLLTDYSDGMLTPTQGQAVDNHLMHCPACRQLAERIRQEVILPFKDQPLVPVDDKVWQYIKEVIAQEKYPEAKGSVVMVYIRRFIGGFNPAMVTAGVCVMLVTALVIHHNLPKQESYLSYMMGVESSTTDDVSGGIEKYFL